MKNKNFLYSVKNAFIGILTAIKQEKNFKIYFLNIIVTFILNIIFKFSLIEYLIWAGAFIGVFSTECINTAIENLCDFLTEEKNEKIKIIKDIAAGAVLWWGFLFYIAEIVMIGAKLI
jgi:diacylglycerol kinase